MFLMCRSTSNCMPAREHTHCGTHSHTHTQTHTHTPCPAPQRWIAYQLLLALAQAHGRGVCHGDIKCENLLMTSWGWMYLADWGPYKPTYLPADNPVRSSFLGGEVGEAAEPPLTEVDVPGGFWLAAPARP